MKNDLPKRKPNRLKHYDYSTPGAYFITICVKNRQKLLSNIIVGDDALVTENQLSNYGLICDKYINNINIKYKNVTVDKYVIMPNHIHLIILLHGMMRTSSPTKNIETIIRSFKTMVSKEISDSIWQRSYYDHIIRDENDYKKIWEYINTNIMRWKMDCFFDENETPQ